MSRPSKPTNLLNSNMSKEEKEKRKKGEKKLQGDTILVDTPPDNLDTLGRKYYRLIVRNFPEGILNVLDGFTVAIVADALAKMHQCQEIIKSEGLLTTYVNKAGAENVSEHKAVAIYNKYAQLYNTYSSKLGMNPSDRARLAMLNVSDEEEDEILKLLRGDS